MHHTGSHDIQIPTHTVTGYNVPPCCGVTLLLWNDIKLSWKLHLPEHLFQIFTYKYGNVVTV